VSIGGLWLQWCEHYVHEGRYTELQIGPAPTQMHTFPVAEESVYQWTEWFKGFMADPAAMHDPDYAVPLRKVNEWVSGPDGMPQESVDDMDRFFEELAHVTPKPEQIVFQGMPWGGLEEHAFGGKLGNGTWFNVSITDETRPWVELATDGTFSATTLDRIPLNFEVNPRWLQKLEESVSAGHDTWLHALFLGTQALEVGNIARAETLLAKSLQMKPHPITARNLATFAPVDTALAYYQMAWVSWPARKCCGSPPCRRCLSVADGGLPSSVSSLSSSSSSLFILACRRCGKRLTGPKTLPRCFLGEI
jgi:hypothetical protein